MMEILWCRRWKVAGAVADKVMNLAGAANGVLSRETPRRNARIAARI